MVRDSYGLEHDNSFTSHNGVRMNSPLRPPYTQGFTYILSFCYTLYRIDNVYCFLQILAEERS